MDSFRLFLSFVCLLLVLPFSSLELVLILQPRHLIAFQPGDELVSVDGVSVTGFSFARVRSAVVGAMGSVVELQVTSHTFCILLPGAIGVSSSLTQL